MESAFVKRYPDIKMLPRKFEMQLYKLLLRTTRLMNMSRICVDHWSLSLFRQFYTKIFRKMSMQQMISDFCAPIYFIVSHISENLFFTEERGLNNFSRHVMQHKKTNSVSKTLPMSPFFNSCVAVTRSDHSVAQLRVAVSQ